MALEPFWTEYDPLNDCTTDEVGGVLSIAIPSGTKHDLWSDNNNAPRILQPANNVDFTIETKITSDPAALGNRGCGLLVEQDHDNWVRFDILHDGTNQKIFAATLASGSTNTRFFTTHSPTFPFWLRLTRSGNNWSCYKSTDGSSFTQQGSTFAHTLTVTSCGLFAATAVTNPAFTATFDYFMADGISNLQTGDHIESGILDTFFSATTIYALGHSELLTRNDVFTAESLAPITSDADANDTMTIRDSYSAEVIRADQLNWTQTTRPTTTWTDR